MDDLENCEDDCKIFCYGCERSFHDIKKEEKLSHDEELPETLCTNSGEHYCHPDCFRDCH